jgi:fatty acid desaturase
MLTIGKPLADMDLTELSKVRIAPFLFRLTLYLALVAGLMAVVVSTRGALPWLALIGLGLMYAHGVELQHQALHNTAFPSKPWNRFVGFFLGLPLLVSYSDYQYSHLRHHRLLGTGDDRELFNYGYDRLTSLKPLLAHLLMLRAAVPNDRFPEIHQRITGEIDTESYPQFFKRFLRELQRNTFARKGPETSPSA